MAMAPRFLRSLAIMGFSPLLLPSRSSARHMEETTRSSISHRESTMRSFLSLIAIALSASLSAAGARRVPTQTESEFGLGNGVGRCLVHKCLVFHGFILSALPKTGDPVAVQVEEWLHGAAADGEPMMVPYEEFPEHSSGDGGFAVATAWQRVKISPNEPVTVVLAMEAGLGVQVGEPILVTSD